MAHLARIYCLSVACYHFCRLPAYCQRNCGGERGNLDTAIYHFVNSLDSRRIFNSSILLLSSVPANFLLPAYSALILIYLFRKKWKRAFDIAMIGALGSVVLFLTKNLFARHRPLDPLIKNVTGYSFPSVHSFSSFTFFGVIIYLIWKSEVHQALKISATTGLFFCGILVAFSRVYLRVHYPSDLLGGFLLSVCWLISSIFLLHQLDKLFVRFFDRKKL